MNKMKTGFLITARMKSTRLPKKLILKINRRQIFRWMIDRLKLSPSIDNIIICTSLNPQDDILELIANEEGIKVFRGSEDDVIQRLYDASIYYHLDYALNITADCPLVSLKYINKIIKAFKNTQADLIRCLNLPHGFYSYGMHIAALKKICQIKKGTDTEVWGRYFTDTGLFKVFDLNVPKNLKRPHYRLTLDYPEDYEFFNKVYKYFGKSTYSTDIHKIIDFLDNHPTVVAINAHCEELYKKRWEDQNRLELK